MKSRRGWIRLGIVLSVGWAVLIGAFATYEYFLAPSSDEHWFVAYVPGSEVDPKNPGFIPDVPSLKVGPLLTTLFLPLAVVWAATPLVVWAISWVRAGFRS